MQNKDGWDGFKKLIRLCKHMKYNISPFYNILKGDKNGIYNLFFN